MIFYSREDNSKLDLIPSLQSNCDYFILNTSRPNSEECVELRGKLNFKMIQDYFLSSFNLGKDIYVYKDAKSFMENSTILKKATDHSEKGYFFLTSNYKGLLSLEKCVDEFNFENLSKHVFSK